MNIGDLFIFAAIGSIFIAVGIIFGVRAFNQKNKSFRSFQTINQLQTAGLVCIGILVAFMISTMFLAGNTAFKTMDTEIINGEVLSKEQERVACSHSYSCRCKEVTSCSGSGKNQSCTKTTVCETCYEHSNDWDWNLITNLGKIEIDRVDRQGKHTPPRWTTAKKGDPVAMSHSYRNYVKAVPESIFNMNDQQLIEKFSSQIPSYPNGIYDYHYIDRAITVGVPVPDIKQYSEQISLMLRELGPTKQSNIILLFVKNADSNYANALKASWLGAKKNDVVVMIGSSEFPKIDWVGVQAWTTNEMFKVALRDDLMALENIDRAKIMNTIYKNVKASYVRQSFKEYQYLEDDIHISENAIIALIIVQLLLGVGAFFFFSKVK